jgi:hypothetical protein
MGPCYIVRRGSVTDLRNLSPRAFAALLLLAAPASQAALGQTLPVTVGQDYATAAAALKARGIAFQEEAAGPGKKISYTAGGESVTIDFTLWPKDPAAPASAWETAASEGKHLVLTGIRDVAPGSDARRAWVRGLEKDGRHWAYLTPQADAARPSADRAKYPVAAVVQWTSPPATLLFEAARATGTPPGNEMTELSVSLDNPHKPRRF